MSFSGIISKNLNNPIIMLIDYTESIFQVKSKYMIVSCMKHYKIINKNETMYIFYQGVVPKYIFELNDNIKEIVKNLIGEKYCMVIIKCIDDIPKEIYLNTDIYDTYNLSYHIDKEKILFTTYNGYESLPAGYYIKIILNDNIEVEKYMFSISE